MGFLGCASETELFMRWENHNPPRKPRRHHLYADAPPPEPENYRVWYGGWRYFRSLDEAREAVSEVVGPKRVQRIDEFDWKWKDIGKE